MATITGTGLRGKRKALDDVEVSREVGSALKNDIRLGQDGEVGLGTQADDARQAARIAAKRDWVAYCDFIRSLPDFPRMTTLWHPSPRNVSIRLPNGRLAFSKTGFAAYQCHEGPIVAL